MEQEDKELERAVEASGEAQHMTKKDSENGPEPERERVSEGLSTDRTAKECRSRQDSHILLLL